MKETFDFQRLIGLLVRYWAEYRKALLLIAVISLPAAFWYETGDGTASMSNGYLSALFVLSDLAFLFFAFRSIDKQERLGHYLLLPASAIEKFLFFLVAGWLLPHLFLLAELYVVKGILFLIQPDVVYHSTKYKTFNTFPAFLRSFIFFSTLFIMRLALPKLNTIRCILLNILFESVLLGIIHSQIHQIYLGGGAGSSPLGGMSTQSHNQKIVIDGGLYADYWPFSLVLLCCFLAAMLYTALLKFREMEKSL